MDLDWLKENIREIDQARDDLRRSSDQILGVYDRIGDNLEDLLEQGGKQSQPPQEPDSKAQPEKDKVSMDELVDVFFEFASVNEFGRVTVNCGIYDALESKLK